MPYTRSKAQGFGRYLNNVLTAVDFLVLNLTFLIATHTHPELTCSRGGLVWLLLNLAMLPTIGRHHRIFSVRSMPMEKLLLNSWRTIAVQFALFVALLFIVGLDTISWHSIGYYYSILAIVFPLVRILERIVVKYVRKKGINFAKTAIVGTNPTALRLREEMASDSGFGFNFVGYFGKKNPDAELTGKYIGDVDKLREWIEAGKVSEVYFTMSGEDHTLLKEVIKLTDQNMIRFFYVPQISRYINTQFQLHPLGSMPVLSIRPNPLSSVLNRWMKRGFDLLFSSVALIFFPLILIPVAIAIKCSSPGPVFFVQQRTGYKGRSFGCIKFRTMKVNAAADSMQATRDDPRKTRVGDFLRRTSIDELPQFVNVWLGQMSVVGPRPHMVRQTEEYSRLIDQYMVRHNVKPGITGWAQVTGFRGSTEELWQMEGRVKRDVWYIEHWSFLLDLKIIYKTLANAIQGDDNAF